MRQYNVPAVEKTIAILEVLAETNEALSATELHSLLGIPKATTFMILNVLERYDVVKKSTDGRFTIGSKLYHWGTTYVEKLDITKVAHPYVGALAERTGLTAHLGILHDRTMMFIDKVEPESFIRFSTFPGMRSDIHVSSLGKAIAAYLPNDELTDIVGNHHLAIYTPHSIADVVQLREELGRIRQDGYAVEDEEGELGVRCIGAPVFDRDARVVAAVSVTGVISQIPQSEFPILGERVKRIADEISNQLGFINTPGVPISNPGSQRDGLGSLVKSLPVGINNMKAPVAENR